MSDLVPAIFIAIFFVLNPFLIDFFFSFIPQHLILVYFYVKFGHFSIEYHLFCFGFFFYWNFLFQFHRLTFLLIKIYLHDFFFWVFLILDNPNLKIRVIGLED